MPGPAFTQLLGRSKVWPSITVFGPLAQWLSQLSPDGIPSKTEEYWRSPSPTQGPLSNDPQLSAHVRAAIEQVMAKTISFMMDDGWWSMDYVWGTASAENLVTAELRQYHLLLDQIFYDILKNTWNTEMLQKMLSADFFFMMGGGRFGWSVCHICILYTILLQIEMDQIRYDLLQAKEFEGRTGSKTEKNKKHNEFYFFVTACYRRP